MYIYSLTVNIDETINDQWLLWMKQTHIPKMLATGKFIQARLCRVLVTEEMGGITYSLQCTAKNQETLQAYYKEDEIRLQQNLENLFANKFVSFSTALEIISEH